MVVIIKDILIEEYLQVHLNFENFKYKINIKDLYFE